MSDLLELPLELIVQILINLPAQDIITCMTLCTTIRDLIKETTEIQLIIELAMQGLRLRRFPAHNNSQKTITTALERIRQFHKWEVAWEGMLPYRFAETKPVKTNYHLTEGVLGLGVKTPSAVGTPDEGFLKGVGFYKLWLDEKPSHPEQKLREPEDCEMWICHPDVGLRIMDFSYDPTQDLLILVELANDNRLPKRVVLRTLTTNEPHPRAKNAVLESRAPEMWTQCDIRVLGDIMSVLFFDHDDWNPELGKLIVWNWTTGEVLLDRIGIGGYAILTSEVLLTLELGVEITPFPSFNDEDDMALPPQTHPTLKPELHLLHMPGASGISDEDLPDIVLGLPLSEAPNSAYLFSETPLRDVPGLPSGLNISPYMSDETAEAIIVLALRYQDKHHVFVSVSRLLKIFRESVASIRAMRSSPHLTSYTPYTIKQSCEPPYYHKWATWGPNATRWLPLDLIFTGYGCIRGSRFCGLDGYGALFTEKDGVILQPSPAPPASRLLPQTLVLMMDFNPRAIKIAKKEQQQEREREKEKEKNQQIETKDERASASIPQADGVPLTDAMWDQPLDAQAILSSMKEPNTEAVPASDSFGPENVDVIDVDDEDDDWMDEGENEGEDETTDPRYKRLSNLVLDEWKWQGDTFDDGEVVSRLPFRLMSTRETRSCLVIMGMDHIVTSSFPDEEGLAKHQIFQFRER